MIAVGIIGVASSVRADHHSGEPPSQYSRLNYWVPTWIRVKAHFEPKTIPLYSVDRYPEVPNPVSISTYPNPSVSPPAYYRGTGLSYDPLGQFMVQPPLVPGK